MAEEKGFDLVEVSPGAKPPVVKMMDYGKYKYEQQKKAAEARKRQKVIEIKEIKMRPTIDDHDYETKMRSMKRFFEEGDKVKVTLRFRGREMAHQHIGMELLTRIQKETDSFAKIEQYPRLEGRQMQMVLAPRCSVRPSGTASASPDRYSRRRARWRLSCPWHRMHPIERRRARPRLRARPPA